MNFREWLTSQGIESVENLQLDLSDEILNSDFILSADDYEAAWELHIELVTRVCTQNLGTSEGDEKAALTSIYSLFAITRDIMKNNGRCCYKFSLLATIMLNQVIRPFTAKWHPILSNIDDYSPDITIDFRHTLVDLQHILRWYSKALAHMAEVQDLTILS